MIYTIIIDASLFCIAVIIAALITSNAFLMASIAGIIYFTVWHILERYSLNRKPILVAQADYTRLQRELQLAIDLNRKMRKQINEILTKPDRHV